MRDNALNLLSNGQWTDYAYGDPQGAQGAQEGCIDIFVLLLTGVIVPELFNSGMSLLISSKK